MPKVETELYVCVACLVHGAAKLKKNVNFPILLQKRAAQFWPLVTFVL
jgi:hypothetical protein